MSHLRQHPRQAAAGKPRPQINDVHLVRGESRVSAATLNEQGPESEDAGYNTKKVPAATASRSGSPPC